MEEADLDALIDSAREKSSGGDVDAAASLYMKAIWLSEGRQAELQLKLLKEAIDFFAAERIDYKLINAATRYLMLASTIWDSKDSRFLPVLDELARAYFRSKSAELLEQTINRALSIQLEISGENSEQYARKLTYAANMLSDFFAL